jgi:endonuclease YncB( thermonuclease family)
MAAKVFGKIVRVEIVNIDRYKREVGRNYLGDRFINLEIVRDGFAWQYVQYDKGGQIRRR